MLVARDCSKRRRIFGIGRFLGYGTWIPLRTSPSRVFPPSYDTPQRCLGHPASLLAVPGLGHTPPPLHLHPLGPERRSTKVCNLSHTYPKDRHNKLSYLAHIRTQLRTLPTFTVQGTEVGAAIRNASTHLCTHFVHQQREYVRRRGLCPTTMQGRCRPNSCCPRFHLRNRSPHSNVSSHRFPGTRSHGGAWVLGCPPAPHDLRVVHRHAVRAV